jgi:formylglycine-generating enzyme required for sulfatase activity
MTSSDLDPIGENSRGSRWDEGSHSGRLRVDVGASSRGDRGYFAPGAGRHEWFKDDDVGPEMVLVPAGWFIMGVPQHELQAEDELERCSLLRESPQHQVAIPRPFAVGRHAITRGQFAAFVDEPDSRSKRARPSGRLPLHAITGTMTPTGPGAGRGFCKMIATLSFASAGTMQRHTSPGYASEPANIIGC